ncbi:retinoblastoma-related 1 [Perilla frutescens var. hirtella]|uniref:Retinoblastoma-related 1 n=1 Tax=Perilla frutescens var. hirtella TaxID=608512 RepID=A0AAD4PFC6_PERFH|nr:retinoblastoma-related 1 [Perilla frutescens var. hirtella]KAH6815304.1 retinoblastoma-related 1 [Perilla frutescens var. frutescens]KAH6837908.1 retinoblastoma-related 1 [Perilla frutescens var. hirtella]
MWIQQIGDLKHMAELKKISSPSREVGGGGTTIEARFAHFCKNDLPLDDDNLLVQATKLFDQSKNLLLANVSAIGTGTLDEAERYWFAFVLYSVRRLSENVGPIEKGLNLCQILRAAKLNIVDFYKELHQFLIKAGSILSNLYGEDWEKRLEAKESHTNFVHLTLLSKKYERAFQDLFSIIVSNDNKPLNVANKSGNGSDYYRFGWLLFLALRVHVFRLCKDLVSCTHGLVSVLAILLIHVPASFRNFNLNDSERIVMKADKADLLASLCNMYDTSEDVLRQTLEKANNLITDILKKKPCLATERTPENLENIVTDGLIYFEDLMDESSLPSSINFLEKDYDSAIRDMDGLDERIFINENDSLLGSGSLSGSALNMSGIGTKRKIDTMSSPTKTISSPLSPYRSPVRHSNGFAVGGMSKMSATPVSTAMTTAKWLRTVIAPLPSKPSAELERFLQSCDRDVTADVTRRAQIILEAIFPSSGPGQNASLMDNIWAEQRRIEAMKLYFRVLQAMCTAESQILHANNLTSLLTNERFHRCMLACSAELVLATHKTVTMLFPTVLERTGITAFDLSKVIESFIRHEETLPRELRRHLNSLEERLLESMVWEKGSSMYNSLIVAKPALSAEITRLGLLAEPMPSLDAIAMHINMSSVVLPHLTQKHEKNGHNGDIRSPKRVCTEYRSVLVERNSFTSPVKDRLLALNNLKSKFQPILHSAFASPTRPNPGGGGETCAETAVNVFFSKIVKLAAVRINGMVERIQLSQHVRESVYCLFQKILGQQTTLFFSRNIDQIILCCLYGVAKISHLSLTFKEIIFNYRKQPHCKPQVFRSVYVDWKTPRRNGKTGPDHVDIITFYNEIFIPAVKPLLVELAPGGSEQSSSHASDAKNNIDGACPASPKPSSFPSLPDMSPKKVSAAHNVYVSPLRSSKMDALISHSSKSYYACVGESTHAYQSPSKDLTAINNRLNGPSKDLAAMNNRLNGVRSVKNSLKFDEESSLVKDAVVAVSLPSQNGNCASPSHKAVKSEQPDS